MGLISILVAIVILVVVVYVVKLLVEWLRLPPPLPQIIYVIIGLVAFLELLDILGLFHSNLR